ncbi:MAG: amidohydrolase [Oscillospiraceae bacterium]
MTTLFTNVTALLMDEGFTTLRNGFVAVDGTDISYVGTERPAGDFDQTIDCTGKVMMPGFVNCHTHIPMTLMRGYGGGHDLQSWLSDFIFPAEDKWDDRSLAAATGLGLAEMIASGVTCIADMYMRTRIIAQQILNAGISANLSVGAVYFGDPADFSPDKCSDCTNHHTLFQQWHSAGNGQIVADASIHAEYTSCAPVWEWVAGFAKEHHLGMHVHISETEKEHTQCLDKYGLTPIQLLDRYGVWDTRAIAAHCLYTTPEDWAIMAQRGVSCVHNPYSNLKLGSGIAPIPAMAKAGVNIALGTDGVSSHNSIDMFADMKLAAVLHNGVSRDPMAMTARQALEMATVNGARALGRNTGRIAAGCTADLVLVDFDAPNLIPCHDEAENLVFSAHGSNVWMNMARGKVIYQNGTFLTLDLEKIKAEVKQYALPLIFH